MKMNNIKVNQHLAEFYGAMLGDGCVSEFYSKYESRRRFVVMLTGHTHDADYYENFIRPIIATNFGSKGYLSFRSKRNATIFVTGNTKARDFLIQRGFPVGLKTKLEMPLEFLSKKELALACVKGIFDTDGSVYKRYSKKYKNHSRLYDHNVIQIKMNSRKVIKQIASILKDNGIQVNRIIKEKECSVLRITKQQDVDLFFHLIKPHNDYHLERYKRKIED